MYIKQCIGYELEKEKSNTSEDFFNRSEVQYIVDGEEKTLYVLYLRYFNEMISKFIPFEQDPIFKVGNRDVSFKETVAICCLLKNSELRYRKRVYINSEKEFATLFQGINFDMLKELFKNLEDKNGYEIRSSMEFIVQPA